MVQFLYIFRYICNNFANSISMLWHKTRKNYLFNLSSQILNLTKDYFQICVFLNGMCIRLWKKGKEKNLEKWTVFPARVYIREKRNDFLAKNLVFSLSNEFFFCMKQKASNSVMRLNVGSTLSIKRALGLSSINTWLYYQEHWDPKWLKTITN